MIGSGGELSRAIWDVSLFLRPSDRGFRRWFVKRVLFLKRLYEFRARDVRPPSGMCFGQWAKVSGSDHAIRAKNFMACRKQLLDCIERIEYAMNFTTARTYDNKERKYRIHRTTRGMWIIAGRRNTLAAFGSHEAQKVERELGQKGCFCSKYFDL